VEGSVQDSAAVLITRLSRQIYRRIDAAEIGMDMKAVLTLGHLREHGGTAPQSTLAAFLCLDANMLVLVLNELEAAGHVVRRRDPADRRRHIVELTAEGRAARDAVDDYIASIEDEILGAMDPAHRRRLRALLAEALDSTFSTLA
jgi:DNA-binding MarR family transcriptional regulator